MNLLKSTVIKTLRSLGHFVFPYHCVACHDPLTENDNETLCSICISDFQYTYFEHFEEASSLDQLFFGRVPLEFTYAMLYFDKNSNTQDLIHSIKYRNNQSLAQELGKMAGLKMMEKKDFAKPDLFISVPLHPKKEFMRGFNQGSVIATGFAKSTKIPFLERVIERRVFTETQTKKGRYERWSNVETVFAVNNPEKWKGKHICLIDDVITTGSTLEACIRVLLKEIPEVKVSVAALACAKR